MNKKLIELLILNSDIYEICETLDVSISSVKYQLFELISELDLEQQIKCRKYICEYIGFQTNDDKAWFICSQSSQKDKMWEYWKLINSGSDAAESETAFNLHNELCKENDCRKLISELIDITLKDTI